MTQRNDGTHFHTLQRNVRQGAHLRSGQSLRIDDIFESGLESLMARERQGYWAKKEHMATLASREDISLVLSRAR